MIKNLKLLYNFEFDLSNYDKKDKKDKKDNV